MKKSSYFNNNWFLDKSKYLLRRENDIIIFVDVDKLLKRHSEDQPDFDIIKKENRIGNRVEKAKQFIENYKNDDRIINPRTGERTNHRITFEPSVVYIFNNKLSFEDGRHRVLAAKEMGLDKVAIEIPKNQLTIFEKWLNKNNKIVMENQKNFGSYGVKLKEYKNKLAKIENGSEETTNGNEKMSSIYPNMTEKDANSIYFDIKEYIEEFPENEELIKIKEEFESGKNKAVGIKYWYKKLYDAFNKRESLKYLKSYKNF